mmetsp:Transcript_36004/g.64437  ORF Transcript_36004/g.64437 Transcript_36004/m.64437 type:complete len:304 (-) Transcript_36004:1224-2135(-)
MHAVLNAQHVHLHPQHQHPLKQADVQPLLLGLFADDGGRQLTLVPDHDDLPRPPGDGDEDGGLHNLRRLVHHDEGELHAPQQPHPGPDARRGDHVRLPHGLVLGPSPSGGAAAANVRLHGVGPVLGAVADPQDLHPAGPEALRQVVNPLIGEGGRQDGALPQSNPSADDLNGSRRLSRPRGALNERQLPLLLQDHVQGPDLRRVQLAALGDGTVAAPGAGEGVVPLAGGDTDVGVGVGDGPQAGVPDLGGHDRLPNVREEAGGEGGPRVDDAHLAKLARLGWLLTLQDVKHDIDAGEGRHVGP